MEYVKSIEFPSQIKVMGGSASFQRFLMGNGVSVSNMHMTGLPF